MEATFPKCGGGVPDPRPDPLKCGGNMRMLREPHIKPLPVVGKCATRTFSSNPSVVKLRSEESSLKRPMLREPHIKGVWPRVLARVYISLVMCGHIAHALLARIMPARVITTRVRSVIYQFGGSE